MDVDLQTALTKVGMLELMFPHLATKISQQKVVVWKSYGPKGDISKHLVK